MITSPVVRLRDFFREINSMSSNLEKASTREEPPKSGDTASGEFKSSLFSTYLANKGIAETL